MSYAENYFHDLSDDMIIINEFNDEIKNSFVDELFKKKDGAFKFDIVNSRDVYEQIQMAEQEQQTMMRFITERKITDWFNSISGYNFAKPFSKDVHRVPVETFPESGTRGNLFCKTLKNVSPGTR